MEYYTCSLKIKPQVHLPHSTCYNNRNPKLVEEEVLGDILLQDLLHTPANIGDAAVAPSGSAGTTHAPDVKGKLPLQRVHYYTFNAILLPGRFFLCDFRRCLQWGRAPKQTFSMPTQSSRFYALNKSYIKLTNIRSCNMAMARRTRTLQKFAFCFYS